MASAASGRDLVIVSQRLPIFSQASTCRCTYVWSWLRTMSQSWCRLYWLNRSPPGLRSSRSDTVGHPVDPVHLGLQRGQPLLFPPLVAGLDLSPGVIEGLEYVLGLGFDHAVGVAVEGGDN